MPNVSVALNGGNNVENVQAVTIGNSRWGQNGSPYGVALPVLDGNHQQITVLTTNNHNQIGYVDVLANHNVALTLTVDIANLAIAIAPI